MAGGQSVLLRGMDSDEFARFSEWSVSHYAEELLESGQAVSHSEALRIGTSDFNGILPDGFRTPDHSFKVIVNERQENVGFLWYGKTEEGAVFIFDFAVWEKYRRRSYGLRALEALETIAAAEHAKALTLYVFACNMPALSLYRKFGFETEKETDGGIFMRKGLRRPV